MWCRNVGPTPKDSSLHCQKPNVCVIRTPYFGTDFFVPIVSTTPTSSPTSTPTPIPTSRQTQTSTPTQTPTSTPTSTPTLENTSTPTDTGGGGGTHLSPVIEKSTTTPSVYLGNDVKITTKVTNNSPDEIYKSIDFLNVYDSSKLIPKRLFIKHEKTGRSATIDDIANSGSISIENIQNLCDGMVNLRARDCNESDTLGSLKYGGSYTIEVSFATKERGRVCESTSVFVTEQNESQKATANGEQCVYIDTPVLLYLEALGPLLPGLSAITLGGAVAVALAVLRSRSSLP